MTSTRKMAWFDAAVATFLALLFCWLIHAARAAARAAERRYGHNVDSGAIEYAVAVIYIAPVAILFALASCSFFRVWPIRWFAHWLAVAAVALALSQSLS